MVTDDFTHEESELRPQRFFVCDAHFDSIPDWKYFAETIAPSTPKNGCILVDSLPDHHKVLISSAAEVLILRASPRSCKSLTTPHTLSFMMRYLVDKSTNMTTFRTLAGQTRRYTTEELRMFSHGNSLEERAPAAPLTQSAPIPTHERSIWSSTELPSTAIADKPEMVSTKAPRRSNRLDESIGVSSSSETVSDFSDSLAKPTKSVRSKRPKSHPMADVTCPDVEETKSRLKRKESTPTPLFSDEAPIPKKSRAAVSTKSAGNGTSVVASVEPVEVRRTTSFKGYDYVEDDDTVISYSFYNAPTYEVHVKVSQIFGHSSALKELIERCRCINWLCGLKNLVQLKLLGDITEVLRDENVVGNLSIFSAALVTFLDIDKLLLLKRGTEVMIAFSEHYEVLILLQKHEPFVKFLAEKRLLDLIPPTSSWDHASHYILAVKEGFFYDSLVRNSSHNAGAKNNLNRDDNNPDSSFSGSRGNASHGINANRGVRDSQSKNDSMGNIIAQDGVGKSGRDLSTCSVDTFLDEVLGTSSTGSIRMKEKVKVPHSASHEFSNMTVVPKTSTTKSLFRAARCKDDPSSQPKTLSANRGWGWGADPWASRNLTKQDVEMCSSLKEDSKMHSESSSLQNAGVRGTEVKHACKESLKGVEFQSKVASETGMTSTPAGQHRKLNDEADEIWNRNIESEKLNSNAGTSSRGRGGVSSTALREPVNKYDTFSSKSREEEDTALSNAQAVGKVANFKEDCTSLQKHSTSSINSNGKASNIGWGWSEDSWRRKRETEFTDIRDDYSSHSLRERSYSPMISRCKEEVLLNLALPKGSENTLSPRNTTLGAVRTEKSVFSSSVESNQGWGWEGDPFKVMELTGNNSAVESTLEEGEVFTQSDKCSSSEDKVLVNPDQYFMSASETTNYKRDRKQPASNIRVVKIVRNAEYREISKSPVSVDSENKYNAVKRPVVSGRLVVSDDNHYLLPHQIACRNGKSCESQGCKYNHNDVCKFGPSCRIFRSKESACRYAHEK